MICVIIFAISPLAIIKLITSPFGIWFSNKTGLNMADFWMGRDNMVLYYLNHHFQSYGLGSTYDFFWNLCWKLKVLKCIWKRQL